MNSENSKAFKPHVLTLNLTSKLDLRIGEKVIALSNVSIYYTLRNTKSSYNNNKFKISAPTWNDEFELPDGPYFLSVIKVTLNTFYKNIEKRNDNLSVQIYLNRIENMITFKIKDGYSLELLTQETITWKH